MTMIGYDNRYCGQHVGRMRCAGIGARTVWSGLAIYIRNDAVSLPSGSTWRSMSLSPRLVQVLSRSRPFLYSDGLCAVSSFLPSPRLSDERACMCKEQERWGSDESSLPICFSCVTYYLPHRHPRSYCSHSRAAPVLWRKRKRERERALTCCGFGVIPCVCACACILVSVYDGKLVLPIGLICCYPFSSIVLFSEIHLLFPHTDMNFSYSQNVCRLHGFSQ